MPMLDLLRHLPDFRAREVPVLERLQAWCSFRTGSFDVAALEALAKVLQRDFSDLGATFRQESLEPVLRLDGSGRQEFRDLGPCLFWEKHPSAARQILLAIHTDVVYADSEKTAEDLRWVRDGEWLHAAGCADAKGGIAIIHEALLALEQSPLAGQLGWKIILNPDEEIGSPGSSEGLQRAAKKCHMGLLFEPSLPDGALVGARKGSGNFTVAVHGKAAHAGRNPQEGRNAIVALATWLGEWAELPVRFPGMTVNVGRIQGGGSVNRVPDFAMAEINVRVETDGQVEGFAGWRKQQEERWSQREGYRCEWFGGFSAPPKPWEGATRKWMQCVQECGHLLGMDLKVKSSGGVCDGNRLAAAGLPNVDTLGPVGDGLHGAGEKMLLPSLFQRMRLTCLILMRLAQEPDWAGDLK
jgi:glutamate carboxypeptidase